jgi:hypothetical protein
MGANPTSFNWTTGTGASEIFSLTTDNGSNGIGDLLYVKTGTNSTVKPFRVLAGAIESLMVDSTGNVGIGTANPTEKLEVVGNVVISGNSTTTNATTTGLAITGLSSTLLKVNSTGGVVAAIAGTDYAVTDTDTVNSKFATSSSAFLSLNPNGGNNVGLGIGTSTPAWALEVASSTRPQFALSDASLTSDIWTMRNAGGNLYFATSSPSSYATSTVSALTIATNGNVGIKSSNPSALLDINNYGTPIFANSAIVAKSDVNNASGIEFKNLPVRLTSNKKSNPFL